MNPGSSALVRAVFLLALVVGPASTGDAVAAPKDGTVLDGVACGSLETAVRFDDVEHALGVPGGFGDGAARPAAGDCAPDEALRSEIDTGSQGAPLLDVHALVPEATAMSPEQVERLQTLIGSVREVLGIDRLLDLMASDDDEVLVDLREASEEGLDTGLEIEDRSPEEMEELEAELIARALASVYRYPDSAAALANPSPHYNLSAYMSNLDILDGSAATKGAADTGGRNKTIVEYLLGLLALVPSKISIILFVGTLILLRLLLVFVGRHSQH
ncbi:MAG: hypothetical protein CMM50_15665 [Rhodospirillaceae bacterium]|nr:hypothetical protein [Rhodospirillaceae bacterium]